MTDNPTISADDMDDAIAGEYVLGVQPLAERHVTETRIRTDPEFAALVQAWEIRLAAMNDGFAEAKAPNLLPAIEARLFPHEVPMRTRMMRRMNPLRWLSGMAVAASLVLLGLTLLVPPKPEFVARLATADARLAYEVRRFGSKLTVTRLAGVPAVAGQVHEIWVIAPDAAPVSLGLLEEGPLVIDYPAPPEGWLMAVSVEPAGGSPTGSPTGPVILTAKVGDTEV